MGKKCFVPNCRSGYASCPERVSLFSPPRDPDKLKVWIENIPRNDKILSRNDRVCEKHFDTEYIIKEWNNGLVTIPLDMPRLSEEAVPTIFPRCPSYLNLKTSKKRLLTRDPDGSGCKRSKTKNETGVVAQTDTECDLQNDDLKANSHNNQGPHCQDRWNKIRTTYMTDSKQDTGQTATKNQYSENLSFLRGYREKIEQDCIDLDDEPMMHDPVQERIEIDTVEIIEDEDEEEEEQEDDEEEEEENVPVTPVTCNTSAANPLTSMAAMTFPGNTYAFPSAMASHVNISSGLPTPMIFTSNYSLPPGTAADVAPVTRISSENRVNSANRVTSSDNNITSTSTSPMIMNQLVSGSGTTNPIPSPVTVTSNRVSFTPSTTNLDDVTSGLPHATPPVNFTGNNYPSYPSPVNPACSPVTVPGSNYSRPARTPPVTVTPKIPPAKPPVTVNSNHMDSDIQRLMSRKTTTTNGKKTSNSSQDSAAVTLMKYILSKQEAAAATPEHPVDAFLKSLAPTLKTFTPYYLNRVKSRIFADVQELELQMLQAQGNHPKPVCEENDGQQRVQQEALANNSNPSEPPVPRPKQLEDIVKIEFDSSSRCPSPAPDDQEYEIERGTTSEFVSWPSAHQMNSSSSTLVYDSTQVKLSPSEHS